MIWHRVLLLQSLAALLIAADPPAPKYPDWPTLPSVPDAMPKPKVVVSVSTLEKDQLYVVQSDLPVQLLASPAGIVQITEEVGPIRVRGKFVDGGGKIETRTYEKKQVFLVERLLAGDVELLMVPKGDVVRRTITDAQNPIPPPKPVDPVDPKVDPKPQPASGLRVLIAYETSANNTREQLNVIHSTKIAAYLDSHCAKGPNGQPEWRKWDQNTPIGKDASPKLKELMADSLKAIAANPLPQFVIVNDKAGKTHLIGSMTETEALALLKQYGGE